MSFSKAYVLTEEQRRMYASEKLENFRWISKLVATYSPYTLTDADLVPESLYLELAELGQFAELAYSSVPIKFLIQNFSQLSKPGYPLEHYDALNNTLLVDSFFGSCADVPVYIAYRPSTRQLVVAISGTSSTKQALHDLRALKTLHPSSRGSVHTGFWALFQGIKERTLNSIRQGIKVHSPVELVLTGHSMGGSLAYLLCMELLTDDVYLRTSIPLALAVFGAPRTGDEKLVTYFHELVQGRPFKEYSVKGYNDGVPALPPVWFGYRHFCKEPIYTTGGKLYRIPATESEHALFRVISDNETDGKPYFFPKGGHNYYNRRDLERFARRINWLDRARPDEPGWEERYDEIMKKHT
ncbi:alpha/beta-hydrolase [Agrocybe pediades]|nr:alpha/beta-hydrolase [Agrocybe pediades]